jgi:hypothetical protein
MSRMLFSCRKQFPHMRESLFFLLLAIPNWEATQDVMDPWQVFGVPGNTCSPVCQSESGLGMDAVGL